VRLGIALGPPRRTATAIELAVRAGVPAAALAGATLPRLIAEDGHSVLLARPGDLLTLCALDALDAAVLGAEELLERGPEVVELLELEAGGARLVAASRRRGATAAAAAQDDGSAQEGHVGLAGGATRAGGLPGTTSGGGRLPRRPRVATTHPWLTRRYLEARGYQPRLVELTDEPWPAGHLLSLDLVVGLLDDGDAPEPSYVEVAEVASGGLRLVAGLAAHALRGAELAAFARRAGEAVPS